MKFCAFVTHYRYSNNSFMIGVFGISVRCPGLLSDLEPESEVGSIVGLLMFSLASSFWFLL